MNTIEVKREKITPELRENILRRDRYTCRYCGSKKEPFYLDHVYPVARGGETSEENLVTSCLNCNVKKHAKVGVFPKPIGYFEDKTKDISMLSVFLLALGLALVGNGFWSINVMDVVWGKWNIYLGIVVLSLDLAKMATGR